MLLPSQGSLRFVLCCRSPPCPPLNWSMKTTRAWNFTGRNVSRVFVLWHNFQGKILAWKEDRWKFDIWNMLKRQGRWVKNSRISQVTNYCPQLRFFLALFFQGFASQLYNESLKDRSKETQWNLFFPCREWSSQPLVAMTTRSLQPRVVLATTRCD